MEQQHSNASDFSIDFADLAHLEPSQGTAMQEQNYKKHMSRRNEDAIRLTMSRYRQDGVRDV